MPQRPCYSAGLRDISKLGLLRCERGASEVSRDVDPDRWRKSQEVQALIKDAFFDVTLGSGVGLREAQGLDDFADEATCASYRAGDEKDDWRRISIEELNACYSSLSFFDAEGMRFHLPAYLLADLNGTYLQDLSFQLAYLNNYSIDQYASLSVKQRQAVRAYLLFILDDDSHAFSHQHIRRALDEYWINEALFAPAQPGVQPDGPAG